MKLRDIILEMIWWILIVLLACLISVLCCAQVNDLGDPQFISQLIPSAAGPGYTSDDFESYSDAAAVNALNGGLLWNGAYADRNNILGTQSSDDLESYSDAAAVDSLNGGNGWNGAFADRDNNLGLKSSDDLESYSDTASVNSLNGGTGWNGAFVDR